MLVVVRAWDPDLLLLAGSVIRASWQGARVVMLELTSGRADRSRSGVERLTHLLGVETHFQGAEEPSVSDRLVRTLRSFRPQAVLCTASTSATVQDAWARATDPSIGLPGLPPLPGAHGRLWCSGGDTVSVPVPLTSGLRHALACLFAEAGGAPEAGFNEYREWPASESFGWAGGAPLPEAVTVTDFFSILADSRHNGTRF